MEKKIIIVGGHMRDDIELVRLNNMPSLSKDIDEFEGLINERIISSDPYCLTLRDKTRDIYDLEGYEDPLSKELKRRSRAMEEIYTHLSNNGRTWRDEYELIKSRKSRLSRYCRDIIVKYFENRSDE